MIHTNWPGGIWDGLPLPSFENAYVGFGRVIDARFNQFRSQMEFRASFTGGDWWRFSDQLECKARLFGIAEFGVDFGPNNIFSALKTLALETVVNPEAETLRARNWDGKSRLDSFFVDHAGARDTPLNRAISRLFFISWVSRTLWPGCDVQFCFVLISKQGQGKGSLLRILAGDPSRYTDEDVIGMSPARRQEAVRGRSIVEASELGGLGGASVEKVKAFISQTHDNARGAWARYLIDQPRTFIYVATCNEVQILRDTTGNRRFLILELGRIDLETAVMNRDQLIAEAVVLAGTRPNCTLPEELWEKADKARRHHMIEDPIDDLLRAIDGFVVKNEQRVTFDDIWTAWNVPKERRTPQLRRRALDSMRRMGWTFDGRTYRIGDRTFRCFRRPIPD